jgi:hypothetical protein
MHFVGLVVSKTGEDNEIHEILEPYHECISTSERLDKGYPTKVVWHEVDEYFKEDMEKKSKTEKEAIMKFLDYGFKYETPETLEYLYGIKTDKPQIGHHHEVFSIYDGYFIERNIGDGRYTGMIGRNGEEIFSGKIKDIYFEYSEDENFKKAVKVIYDRYVKECKEFPEAYPDIVTFEQYLENFKNNNPGVLINGLDWKKTDVYADYTNNRTDEENYNDFIKAIKELDPELYVTVIDFHC